MCTRKISPETIELVKKYLNEYHNLTMEEIGKICGVSRGTVWNISKGYYDEPEDKPTETEAPSVVTNIPWVKVERLLACEQAIKEILRNCVISNSDPDMLYIHSDRVDRILKTLLPHDVDARIDELR